MQKIDKNGLAIKKLQHWIARTCNEFFGRKVRRKKKKKKKKKKRKKKENKKKEKEILKQLKEQMGKN